MTAIDTSPFRGIVSQKSSICNSVFGNCPSFCATYATRPVETLRTELERRGSIGRVRRAATTAVSAFRSQTRFLAQTVAVNRCRNIFRDVKGESRLTSGRMFNHHERRRREFRSARSQALRLSYRQSASTIWPLLPCHRPLPWKMSKNRLGRRTAACAGFHQPE